MTSFLKTNTAALTEDKALFQQSLAAFIRCNENPSTSPNFKSKVPDLPGPLLQLLEHAAAKTDQALVLLLLKVCLPASVIDRKQHNATKRLLPQHHACAHRCSRFCRAAKITGYRLASKAYRQCSSISAALQASPLQPRQPISYSMCATREPVLHW